MAIYKNNACLLDRDHSNHSTQSYFVLFVLPICLSMERYIYQGIFNPHWIREERHRLPVTLHSISPCDSKNARVSD